MRVKHSFPPIVDKNTRLLLLGSLPGEMSLAQSRYYANPRNQFWALMGEVLDIDLVQLPYDERLERLLQAGVGLWDVVASASREGSLDTRIRGHVANELATFAKSLLHLRAVAFNGRTAALIGRRQIGSVPGLRLIDLPSSSPALTLPLARKREHWLALREWLAPPGTGRKP